MLKFVATFIMIVFGFISGSPANAQDQATRITIVQRYVDCYEMKVTDQNDDAGRLACYDKLVADMPDILNNTDSTPTSTACEIEGWTFTHRNQFTSFSGAMTCSDGKLNIRFYDGDDFIGSTVAYVEGFAFQSIVTLSKRPPQLGIKYTFEKR